MYPQVPWLYVKRGFWALQAGRVAGFCALVTAGIVAIVVGSFMIRGTMHMWDGRDEDREA